MRLLVNPKEYSETGTIVGKIVDSHGNPVKGVTVFVSGSNDVLTDSKGNYKLESVPSGLAVIKVSKPVYISSEFGKDLITDNEVSVDFTLNNRRNISTEVKDIENGLIGMTDDYLDSLSKNDRLIANVTDKDSTGKITASLTNAEVGVLKSIGAVHSLQRKDMSMDIPMENLESAQNAVISTERMSPVDGSLSAVYKLTIEQESDEIRYFSEPVNLNFKVDERRSRILIK